MDVSEIADCIDDLVAVIGDTTCEKVIDALVEAKIISSDDAVDLKEELE